MPEPIAIPGTSVRHQLAFLYPGQAQKEMLVNEALCRIDSLLHPVIAGVAAAPPAQPQDGEAWIVGQGATGPWAGRSDQIAAFCAGSWVYCRPHPGMRVWHAGENRSLLYSGNWSAIAAPSAPTGGSVIDAEARGAIAGLIAALVQAGILAS